MREPHIVVIEGRWHVVYDRAVPRNRAETLALAVADEEAMDRNRRLRRRHLRMLIRALAREARVG